MASGKAAEKVSLKQGRCFGAVHLSDNRQHPSRHAGLDFTNPTNVAPGRLPRALHIKNHSVVLLALRDGCHGTPPSVLRMLDGEVSQQVKKVSDRNVVGQHQDFAVQRYGRHKTVPFTTGLDPECRPAQADRRSTQPQARVDQGPQTRCSELPAAKARRTSLERSLTSCFIALRSAFQIPSPAASEPILSVRSPAGQCNFSTNTDSVAGPSQPCSRAARPCSDAKHV